MDDWRKLAKAEQWDQIIWESLDTTEQQDLLALLRAGPVPKKLVKNGMEEDLRYKLFHEVEGKPAKFAAYMLAMLSAIHDPEPNWIESSEDYFREVLTEAARGKPGSPKQKHNSGMTETQGDAELSLESHANSGLRLIEEYRRLERMAAGTVEDDGPASADWLISWMQEAASISFQVGCRMQAVWAKSYDKHALRGLNNKNRLNESTENFNKLRAINKRQTSKFIASIKSNTKLKGDHLEEYIREGLLSAHNINLSKRTIRRYLKDLSRGI